MSAHLAARPDREIAERLLSAALAAGAEAADVVVIRDVALEVGVARGALEEAERSEQVDIGLRVIVGRRQASVSASDDRPEIAAEMAERAVAIASEAPDDPWCGLAEPSDIYGETNGADLDLCDPSPQPAPDTLEAMALEAEAAGLAITGVSQIEQARASWGADRITLVASNGITHSLERTLWAVSASAIAGEGLGRERDYAAEIRRHGADMPPAAEVGALAGARAVAALGAQKPKGGRVPVLFDERVAASLVGHILGAINGSSIARGASWLRDAMGERILPAGLDIVEEPHRPRGRASRLIDAEGIATTRRHLVADGVLQSWVLDLATARQLGLATTGNARRGTSGPPRPGVSNIALTQGTESRDALLREMGTGLLVTSLIGSSINPNTGNYSRGASGFWVEGGEIRHAVNEITLAGNLREMIASLRPADDADPNRAMQVPSLLVEGLTVGA